MHNFMDAKLMAKLLRQGLAERSIAVSHSDCLELVARQFGVANWNILSARIDAVAAEMTPLVMPEGWRDMSPSGGDYFRMGFDPAHPNCVLIESTPLAAIALRDTFGTMAQTIDAAPYARAAVRVSCELSSENLDGAATMWLRIDGANGQMLAFENLMTRPGVALKGTEDWKGFAVTLDVPEAADSIVFGFLVKGRGAGRARSFTVDRVEPGDNQGGSSRHRMDGPVNLGFGA